MMTRLAHLWTAHAVEPSHFMRHALMHLRWAVLAGLLLVALLVPPRMGRIHVPTWVLLALFAGYALLYDVLGRRLPRRRFFRGLVALDLPLAGLVYALGTVPGSLPFILLLLAVVCAAVILSPRGALLYTGVAAALVAVVNPTLHYWSPRTGYLQEMGSELLVLGLVAGGVAVLARRLALEHQAAEARHAEATRLTELDRRRASAIAMVAHDVRQPLTAIGAGLGLLEVGAHDRLRPDERALLAGARQNGLRLRGQIDDLLAASQIEAGTLRLDPAPLDLREVVSRALAVVQPQLRATRQELHLDLPDALPLVGDARLLEQVVVNLLANAHTHTPPGTRITVSGRRTARDVHLIVRDTGPGIPPDAVEAIFTRFHRLDQAVAGTGLGLSIVQAIVALHGGRVWAESQGGPGATFHVTLPHDLREARDDADVARGGG